jgi:lipoprotein-anchoring transpeptidase ErfK/SrfK
MRGSSFIPYIGACVLGIATATAVVFSVPAARSFAGIDGTLNALEDKAQNLLSDSPFAKFGQQTTGTTSISDDVPAIAEQGKAIVANLDAMKVWTYEDGKPVKEYSILSKGKPGSAWETPTGTYGVKYKTERHLSSIGGVYMPYSMQFFGNFFIHGWPYYVSGAPVPEGYSGGCIRMSDEDAKEIYEFASVGTPLVIRGGKEESAVTATEAAGEYRSTAGAKQPQITAISYLVADLDTGDIIVEKDSTLKRPIASLTKLMTALVSLEVVNQFTETTISDEVEQTYGAQGGIIAGQTMMVRDLLYPLLLSSSNDAAEAIAEVSGRNYFIRSMNDKAESIGLADTYFDDPSGLSADNVSTAHDLFELTRYLYRYKKYILDVTARKEQTVGEKTWDNISRFEDDEGYIGGKNGYTDEAMHTLIVTLEQPLAEFEDRHIAYITLGSKNKEEDMRALMNYVDQYVYFTHDGVSEEE